MSLADQFASDAAAGGAAASSPQMTLAQQFAADAAAGAQSQATQARAQAQQTAADNGLAADLAGGGAAPDTLAQIGQIGRGAAHGIGSMFSNAANFVEKGVSAGLNAIPGVRDTGLARAAQQGANADVLSQAQADQAFKQNASPGAQAASVIAPMLVPMSGITKATGLVGKGVGMIPGMGNAVGRAIGTGLGNAAAGAALSTGALIDPNGPDYWSQVAHNALIGGGLGAAIPAAIAGGRAIGSNVINALAPVVNPQSYVGRGFAGALGDQAANVAQNIRSAPQFVPGSMPTTAQAGANPVLVATEKAAANANPDFRNALAQRAISNNDARWQALMGVAQDPAALQAAQDARAAATQPLYDAAHQQTANVGRGFVNFAQRPAVQQAMQQADQLARNEGVQLTWPTPQNRAISGQALDYTNRALGDMIDAAKRSGNNQQARALTDAQSYLKSWTQTYVPGVRQAAQAYQQASIPINTMEIGQQIANGLGTRAMNAGGAPEIQMMPFRSALTSAMKGAPYGIDASALQQLQGIGQDLQRATVSNSLRSPGSDTAYNLAANGWLARQLYGPTFGGAGNIGKAAGAIGAAALGHPMIGLGILGGGNKVGQMVGNRLNSQLSNFLLDPSALLPYLDARASPSVNAAQQALPGLLQRQLLPAVVGGVTRGGLMNSQ